MRFLVIGGDAAGMSAASRAKRNYKDLEVIVLERTFDVSYSACGMPYNIADADRDMDDLVVRQAQLFIDKQGIDLRTGHFAEKIDPVSKRVSGRDHQGKEFLIPYDKLLIATGASPIMPKFPGADKDGVMCLKNLEDGRRIKNYIQSKKVDKVVIIGMGYIALEMCEALKERGLDVCMVKPRPVFLPWMHTELSGVVQNEIVRHGVVLYLGHDINRIEEKEGILTLVGKDMNIDCQMVIVATGVTPNNSLADGANLELGQKGSIAVGKDMRSSAKDIFAAGDCADAYHVVTGKKTWIPLALRANRAGWAVADNLIETKTRLEGVAGTAVFKVFDLQVAKTGLNVNEARAYEFDPIEVVVKNRSRAHAHPGSNTIYAQMVGDKKTGRILGCQLVGVEGVVHRINAVAVALHQKMTVEAFIQCDMAYAPPFGPVWDPTLTVANQLYKAI